jgi:hypothetical protein
MQLRVRPNCPPCWREVAAGTQTFTLQRGPLAQVVTVGPMDFVQSPGLTPTESSVGGKTKQ